VLKKSLQSARAFITTTIIIIATIVRNILFYREGKKIS